MSEKTKILGVPIDNVNFQEAVKTIKDNIEYNNKKIIVTPNSEMLLYATKDDEFKSILKSADLVVPDGAGVILASRILGKSLQERVAGVDLVNYLLKLGNEEGFRFYFLGGTPEVAKKVKNKMEKEFPGTYFKTHHGYFDKKDEEKIIKDLKSEKYDILLVGMGTPRQEKWLYKNMPEINVSLGMGVGGSFDVLTGEKKRAPEIMQKLYLEWFFRLCQEPKRIVRMGALPLFLGKVFMERLSKQI